MVSVKARKIRDHNAERSTVAAGREYTGYLISYPVVGRGMQAFPIITSEMKQREAEFLYDESGRRIVEVTPWYREWYTVAGAGAVLLAGSILTFALISGGVDADREETIGN